MEKKEQGTSDIVQRQTSMDSFGKSLENLSINGALSYWKSDTSEPQKFLTIGQLIHDAATRFSDRIAISIYRGPTLTYVQVKEQKEPKVFEKNTETLAAAFIALGLRAGDHVAIWGFNSLEWYLAFIAITKAGLVAVNLNPLFEEDELRSCLSLSDAKALILNESTPGRSLHAILNRLVPEINEFEYNQSVKCKILPCLATIIVISERRFKGTYNWQELFTRPDQNHRNELAKVQSRINVFDICDIQFTSGTTNEPKGVLLSHHNLVNNGYLVGKYLLLAEKHHRPCVLIPFFHAYGLSAAILASIWYGATPVIPYDKYNSTKAFHCIIEEKCTLVYGTPTMYIDLLSVVREQKRLDRQIDEIIKRSSLERFFTGGAICHPQVIGDLRNCFPGIKITSGYGMTELSPVTFMSLPDEPDGLILNSVGRLLDNIEMKIVDENREIVPLGTAGELSFRGAMVMKGYYKNAEKTAQVIDEEGWFYTGDRFVLLENGYAQIVGRIKDTIIRGGENIEPKEIEEIIIKHQDIIDVQVYAVNDQRLGEAVAASILKTKDSLVNAEDIREFCRGKIASYKIPKYIIFCDEYPKTASGKIQKFKLRATLEQWLTSNKWNREGSDAFTNLKTPKIEVPNE